MRRYRDLILLLLALAIAAMPLLVAKAPAAGGARFLGADGEAQDLVGKMAPEYRPWARPLWTPPSEEVASGLFALQAGLGCGFLGYYIGLSVGRKGRERQASLAEEGSAES